jgi:hypothetical protein
VNVRGLKGPLTYHAVDQGLIITSTVNGTYADHAELLLRAIAEVGAVELPTGAVGQHRDVRRALSARGVGLTIVGEVVSEPVRAGEQMIDHVRGELKRVGRTQADLARALHWTPKHVNQLLLGKQQGTIAQWQMILDELGLVFRVGRREAPEEDA